MFILQDRLIINYFSLQSSPAFETIGVELELFMDPQGDI